MSLFFDACINAAIGTCLVYLIESELSSFSSCALNLHTVTDKLAIVRVYHLAAERLLEAASVGLGSIERGWLLAGDSWTFLCHMVPVHSRQADDFSRS